MTREHAGIHAPNQTRLAAGLAWEGALAGLGDADAADRALSRLHGKVPWQEVVTELERLHLGPLFHFGLHAFPPLQARVPDSVRETLGQAVHGATARITQLERACTDVVTAATAAGIPVLLLKGLALGTLLYPSVAARPMDDVDLLVSGADRDRLTALLRGRGYRNDLRGEEDFYPPGSAYSIDLHTGLVNSTRIPARHGLWPVSFEDLWGRSQTVILGGVPVRTLGPRHTLLHLAIHTVHHHGFGGMLGMVDLLAGLRAWPLSPVEASDAPPAVRRSLWYCLEVLASLGQDPVPEVRGALRPGRLLPGERWVLAAVGHADVPEAIRYAFTLICLPHWRMKSAYLRQLLFPDASIYTKDFADAGGSAPGWITHWQMALALGRQVLRALADGWAGTRRSVSWE